MSNNDQPSSPGSESPTKKMPSAAMKTEPEHGMRRIDEEEQGQEPYSEAHESASTQMNASDSHIDYADDTPVHPLAPAPHSPSPPNICESPAALQMQSGQYMPFGQPQQHQQLLKLKTEHGFPSSTSPLSTPDIVMTNDDSDDLSHRGSPEANLGSNEAIMGEDSQQSSHLSNLERGHLVVDTSSHSMQNGNNPSTASTPTTSDLAADTPITTGPTAPSSRRPSLRTMTPTLPRSALQEETIALFKQYRNLIPCAKCFCRNTIQRDGMSDGNLRFKCRPPVSMSLICNKSYSESKIRNMIAGVVYGHSLPDSNTPTSATSPGDNVLALAPPPTTKASRRSSKGSPRIGPEMTPERMQRLQEDQEQDELHDERDCEGMPPVHPMDSRRPSLSHHMQQISSSRRGSLQHLPQHQPIRRPSVAGDESMMMEYEDPSAQLLTSSHSSHLQVPGTPPMEGEDTRFYRSRPIYGQQSRTTASTGLIQAPPQAPGRQVHKLHHSHSHPNIGQQRHQQYLEQQEREHRGSVSGIGYPNQQQQSQPQPQQRAVVRQTVRRDSSHYLGGAERRSSQPSPVMNASGSKYMGEALSPALSSSPRSSPSRELVLHQQGSTSSTHDPLGTPTLRAHTSSSRCEDSSNSASYFQRRMSQPHSNHAYNSSNHAGLPPPLPSPLSHPYDRRASEAEEYPQMHREKYERLNANTMLAPSSALGSSRHSQSQQRNRSNYPPGFPNSGLETRQHPLDVVDQTDDALRQAMTPPTRSVIHSGPVPSTSTSLVSSPWMSGGSGGQGVPSNMTASQSEPMRYSHSLPMGQNRPSLRHHYSSSSLYYQTPRVEETERFDSENDRDTSPDYQDFDADGRPIARMRAQGLKRKSFGQSLSRSSSNQNLYSTSLQQHQYQYTHQQPQRHIYQQQQSSSFIRSNSGARDLNAAMPGNAIKLTCFPNYHSKTSTNPSPTTKILDTSEAMALQLSQSSKIVIEIRQPRLIQSYSNSISGNNSSSTGGNDAAADQDSKSMHRSNSQSNLQHARPSSTVLGYRRSPSPDRLDFGGSSSKKRRADSDSVPSGGSGSSDSSSCDSVNNEKMSSSSSSSSVAEAAAAAVVAAAAAAAAAQSSSQGPNSSSTPASSSAIQMFGIDYLTKTEDSKDGEGRGGVGLGLSTAALTSSPTIEALQVAKSSSYALLEDQKEMGIDYSLFTRVETAGWRILIPPNVVASFRSEDFGLMLKPKGVDVVEDQEYEVKEEEGEQEQDKWIKDLEAGRGLLVHNEGGQQQEDDDDVNVEGVRRIALRDDDREHITSASTEAKVTGTTAVAGPAQDKDDQEMGEEQGNETADSEAAAGGRLTSLAQSEATGVASAEANTEADIDMDR
ncbi:hypothetical protein BGZ58_006560 [Dissophora ornata]|nr:hypothetical protein BGZ58_006560 [Dissophora ornata]